MKDGLHGSAEALASCLNALLKRGRKGYGSFTVRAEREAQDRIRLYIDGGIESWAFNIVGDGVQVDVVCGKDGESVHLRLRPDRRTAA